MFPSDEEALAALFSEPAPAVSPSSLASSALWSSALAAHTLLVVDQVPTYRGEATHSSEPLWRFVRTTCERVNQRRGEWRRRRNHGGGL